MQRTMMIARTFFRLVVALIASVIGFLTFFRPPTFLLWYVRLGVTEWGYWLAPLIVVPLVKPLRRMFGWSAWLIGVAALLAQVPLVQALFVARTLPGQLVTAFGPGAAQAPGDNSPFVLARLLPARTPNSFQRLVYARHDGLDLHLDLYQPTATARPAPLVVVIHGGSWQSGDSQQLPDLSSELVRRGYAVASLDYRLAPQYRFPAAGDDVAAALDFLTLHASEYGIDAGNIVLLGRSAGAQLAVLAGYTLHRPAIRGVISFYGPVDLVWGYDHPANPAVIDSRGVLEAYIGGAPSQVPEAYTAASPIEHVDATTPPTLFIHGAKDEMVFLENSQRLAARLASAGRPHFILELPWAAHAADANIHGPSGQLSTYAVERFLTVVMARTKH